MTHKNHNPNDGGAAEVDGLNALSDASLVARIARGQHAAYSVLVMRHANRYVAVAEKVLYQRQEAEDAVQDAFVKLWQKADQFEPETAKFSTWFYRIVVNQCLDRKRKKTADALPEDYDIKDDSNGPEENLVEDQRAQQMQQAMDLLPERQKTAIVLCYYEGMSNKEAADVLEVNIKALESLLTRGRKGLKENLDKCLGMTAKDMLNT